MNVYSILNFIIHYFLLLIILPCEQRNIKQLNYEFLLHKGQINCKKIPLTGH